MLKEIYYLVRSEPKEAFKQSYTPPPPTPPPPPPPPPYNTELSPCLWPSSLRKCECENARVRTTLALFMIILVNNSVYFFI